MNRIYRDRLAASLLLLLPLPAAATPPALDTAEIDLALERLGVLGSVLYVAAHPDDENTELLAYLARGRHLRTAYLSVTRGDGGQNLIGPEKGEPLGLIRTHELLAARRVDGAEQYFTRAIDFGYTKSVDETLAVWGREEVLGDVVRVIRRFRPDVIINRFSETGGGHGQHTASAVLAVEAFRAAGDRSRFAEQLDGGEGLEPWRATRLLLDSSRPFAGDREASAHELTLELGGYSPRLGRAFPEIAAASRTMHKSQGFGSAPRRGSRRNHLRHLDGERAGSDLLDGVDATWARVEGGEPIGRLLAAARERYDPRRPADLVPALLEIEAELSRLPPSPWVAFKRQELLDLIAAAGGLWLELLSSRPTAAPGESVELVLEAINRSPHPFVLERVELPFGVAVERPGLELEIDQPATVRAVARLPPTQEPSRPYWLEQTGDRGRYRVGNPELIGLAEEAPLSGRAVVRSGDRLLTYELPLLYRWTDRVEGERRRRFSVLPPVLAELEQPVMLFTGTEPKPLGITLSRPGEEGEGEPVSGTLSLDLPSGWRVRPASEPFVLLPGTRRHLEIELTPPAAPARGRLGIGLELDGSRNDAFGLATIDYPHIPIQTLLRPAAATLVRLDLLRRKQRIGYLMGAGDDVPTALRQLGYEVSLLGDPELESGRLEDYEAIVVGVRAYNTRPALLEHNRRLLAYVERGGTLVVQYNTASRRGPGLGELGPYPMSLSRHRVSVEEAPVTLLAPTHPVLTGPNRIGPADFDGWVQERGLYFPGEWDERYTALLGANDPGEPERRGGLLVARHGDGAYIYTGYSFFRQLPAGVAGAFRLFVNLIEIEGRDL